ncbi:hypothetical protein P7C73_g1840, partial [Tremellales sp. Uapishka_1]
MIDEAALFASPLPLVGSPRITTRKELWSWYLYYVGNSGLGPFNFAISAWQNLLYLAGWDPAFARGTVPCGDGGCSLNAFGSDRSINSIVLITNGLSFALQAVTLLVVGSFADYGTWRPHITTAFTLLGWGVSFGWLGVETASKWQIGTALYILGLISYQCALTFWTAAFPGLARDLPHIKESEEKLSRGETDRETHEHLDMLARNRLANVSFFVCSIGELIVLAILAGILQGIVVPNDTASNTQALSVVCAYSAGVWSELPRAYPTIQAMISEVVPRGKEFLFFALFSLMGKASSFIGPFVSSAIIDDSGNTNMPFTFLLGLGVFAVAILFCVDVDKSRIECRQYLDDEAMRVYEIEKGSMPSLSQVTESENVEGDMILSHQQEKRV